MNTRLTGRSNYLGPAVAAALTLHGAVIFGIGFETRPAAVPERDLDITLVQHPVAADPEKSRLIAPFSQLGSDVQTDGAQAVSAGGQASDDAAAEDIADLRARLDRQRQQHASLLDTLVLTAASAKASDQAAYLKHWVERVERTGNDNYPQEARRKGIFGAIRLAVTLERDGRVAAIDILQSSGQRVLDQAAMRILRLAAPFAPIPESISEDRIEIIRTWHFIPGHQFAAGLD